MMIYYFVNNYNLEAMHIHDLEVNALNIFYCLHDGSGVAGWMFVIDSNDNVDYNCLHFPNVY